MIASEFQKSSEFVAGAFVFSGFVRGYKWAKTAESPLPDTLHFCLPEERSREAAQAKKSPTFPRKSAEICEMAKNWLSFCRKHTVSV